MKRLISIIAITLGLVGCVIIPSFRDDNESASIITIVSDINRIDCTNGFYSGLYHAQREAVWLITYSSIRGSKDVTSMVSNILNTIDPFVSKARTGQMTVAYCTLKKQILQKDTQLTARSLLGRF